MHVAVTNEALPLFCYSTIELQWLEHLWNHKKMFETGVVELLTVYHSEFL